ncbi:hypothetical protein NLI96_g4229 [Meripilus lineatus]|uniref:BTB domain-containing protein n=1 Tax=Meripilus lineatus TaxID=2056292 RepID=A0AAD5YKA3_9APHY|nr:hypothetical protein NLI96_g4229 [Physisporinus lineatus]
MYPFSDSASSSVSSDPLQIPGLLPSFPESLKREFYLQEAYKASLTGGTFYDTKFYAFSRRRSSGSVDLPKTIFANSAILRASSQYFIGLLVGGFAEDTLSDLNGGFPSGKATFNADYEYEEDSDLDDEIGAEEDSVDANEKDYSTGSGVALFDQVELEGSPGQSETAPQRRDLKRLTNAPNTQLGRVVVIPDVAFATWRALVYYLGTGEISFSPLRSQKLPPKAVSLENSSKEREAPPCSPKSMYRLAHQLQLKDLQNLAFKDIKSKLTAENIFNELFSPFSARYPEIIEVEAEFLCQLPDHVILQDLSKWADHITHGRLPHASPALVTVMQKLIAFRSPNTPWHGTPAAGAPASPIDLSPIPRPAVSAGRGGRR